MILSEGGGLENLENCDLSVCFLYEGHESQNGESYGENSKVKMQICVSPGCKMCVIMVVSLRERWPLYIGS